MFEARKVITVGSISFDMILVEGDLVKINGKTVDLEDYYIAEIPVTQELYMAVMGSNQSASYNMIPDNFDYLDPRKQFAKNG